MSKATCLILRSFALSVSDNSFGVVLFRYSVMMSSKVLVADNSFSGVPRSVSLGAKIALTHDIWLEFGIKSE